ncbi:KpsF/GutQ family sugar-phosphate isomerase [Phytophthora cinnamomi]|uniref:KpsF/GutQ family sugar-phosphate isomerase n=1 Tax=Phytophthora cinnamomi TaxID=4785 RepID=UPI00355955F5|nr:KpsF/GutQ family sugar-phosphate isomerase [Phytophthora cinnamomi]
MLRSLSLQAHTLLARRSAASCTRAIGSSGISIRSDTSAKDPLACGSASLRSVASDVYALQKLFRSLASDSDAAQSFTQCVTRVLQCHDRQSRVFVTGIGKSGAVARRLASTLSSISISSQWVHGGEWVHGELGGLKRGDVVVVVSHSGRTAELLPLPKLFHQAGCGVVAIVGDARSPLSKQSDVAVLAAAEDEADCPVPARSIVVQEAVCNAIVQQLVENLADGADRLRESHPGGAIGARFAN